MAVITTRRSFLIGALAAPAIVRAVTLMPLRGLIVPRLIVETSLDGVTWVYAGPAQLMAAEDDFHAFGQLMFRARFA